MRYVSVFSGVEAATLAWDQLGWEPVAFIETVAGFALMAVAFGPRATAMIAFEAYRPRLVEVM